MSNRLALFQPRWWRAAIVGRAAIRALVLAVLAVVAVACAGRAHDDEAVVHALEDRVLAPCCWRDPLRDHVSELASALRAELRQRLAAGESSAAIEADLVRRYGERIRALPANGDPRWMIVAAFAALAGAGLFALWRVLHPRTVLVSELSPSSVTGAPAAGGAAPQASAAQYEARLDDDLSVVD